MSHSHASTYFSSCLTPFAVAASMTLAACGGGGEAGGSGDALAKTDVSPRVVEQYVCMDERQSAIDFTLGSGVPAVWDGTPFPVDISSTFSNADELLEIVSDEAFRIRDALGYDVIVPGEIVPLTDFGIVDTLPAGYPAVPAGRISIHCCSLAHGGIAFPQHRFFALQGPYDPTGAVRFYNLGSYELAARNLIIHELYHLLGFGHPDSHTGIPMTDLLMWGTHEEGLIDEEAVTTSTDPDLARLACVYD